MTTKPVQILRSQDFAAGLLFLLGGVAGAALSSSLPAGTAARMGPGFFPMIVAGGLACTGLLILVRAVAARSPKALPGPALWPLLCVIGSAVVFGAALERVGLLLSVTGLVVLARLAEKPFRPVPTLLLAAGAAAFSVVVFLEGLGLPIRTLP